MKKVWKALDIFSPSDIKLHQLPRKPNGLYNLHFNEFGQLEKRAGYSKYNTTSIGASHKIVGMHRSYTQANLKEFLVAWNDNIYKLSDSSPHGSTSIKSSLTADSDTYFCDFLDHCYIVNGVDGVFKYDRSNVRTMGITAPSAASTENAIGAGGSLGHGTYKFKYTFVDEDGYESNGSPVSNDMETSLEVLEDCEDTWDESNDAECTASLDTTNYKTGSGSAKFVVTAVAEANDILATELMASTDMTGKKSIKLWVKCSVETSAGDLQILLDDTADCASPLETLDIPALEADKWKECTINLADPSSDGAIVSIGLKYVTDLGVCTVHLDDIRSIHNAPNNKITINISTGNIGAVTFAGAGLDDATSGGIFTGAATLDYKIQIDGEGTPDTFKWSDDGGSNWDVQTVAITGSAQTLNNGVTITFAATTGHTNTEYWEFTVRVDPKITERRIYRTSVNGAIYYYDGEIEDNTTTTYNSTIADNTLGTELHTNHTAPLTTSHLLAKRRNKLYLANADYLYPSHTSDVEYYPATWAIRVGNSQKITGLLEQLTALPVTTEDSIERLVGTDEDNFEFKNSYSTEGCVAMRSYVNCDNLIVYLGFNGINYFDGTTSGIFSKALNEYVKDNIVDAYRHLSCAIYWDNKYILCYPRTGTTYPTETVWYDLKNKTYGVYSFAFSCFSKWDRGTDGLQLYGGSNTEGRVYKLFNGLDDDGSNLSAWDSPEPFDLGYPELWKQFYNIYIKVKSTTGTALTMYYTLDDTAETSASLTMTANKTLWYKIDLGQGGQRGRAIKIRPCISDKYAFTIMGYAIVYELEKPEYA